MNILENGLAPGELININVPAITPAESRGVEVTRMGKRVYQDELIERLDPRGIPYYWIGGPPPSGLAEPGTDFHAVVNKRIAITPIQLDLTARRMLSRLNSWSWKRHLPPSRQMQPSQPRGRMNERTRSSSPRPNRRRNAASEGCRLLDPLLRERALRGRRLCRGTCDRGRLALGELIQPGEERCRT